MYGTRSMKNYNDWIYEPMNDRYKHKHSDAEVTAMYLLSEIERLDPQRNWYNTDYHINGLLNSIIKKV